VSDDDDGEHLSAQFREDPCVRCGELRRDCEQNASGVWVCEDCRTVEEVRWLNQQCERCGRQFREDEAPKFGLVRDDEGWITPDFSPGPQGPYLCPDCQTPDENAAEIARFSAFARRVRERAELGELTPEEEVEQAYFEARLRYWERDAAGRQAEADELTRQIEGDTSSPDSPAT
jgi:hypothetical protein